MTSDQTPGPLSLDAPDLVARLEQLSREALDSLPFGVIRLNAEGVVEYYSKTEAVQSGFRLERAYRKRFFSEIAPCLATPELLDRMERARRAGTLDISLEQVGDFADPNRLLRVRISAAADGGLWVALQRPELAAISGT